MGPVPGWEVGHAPVLVSSPRKGNLTMIASEVQQRIDQLADQLQNIRGYL